MTRDSSLGTRLLTLALCTSAMALEAPAVSAQQAAAPAGPSSSPPDDPTTELTHKPDTRLSRYRTPFEVLTERAIGRTGRRVRYDWRRSSIQLAANLGMLADLNNFDSLRIGAQARRPSGNLLYSLDLSYVRVSESRSSRLLALTPYRQPGRPNHWEMDFSVSYPLAEGVMTSSQGFVPPTELVFSALGHLRYFVYPKGYRNLSFRQSLATLVSPRLSNRELRNLEGSQPPGMTLDPARLATLLGLGTDLYFQSGVFLSLETLVAVPILSGLNDSQLEFSLEGNFAVGLSL